jgi:hypothetical protein
MRWSLGLFLAFTVGGCEMEMMGPPAPIDFAGADLTGVDMARGLDGPVFNDDMMSDPGAPTITAVSPMAMDEVHYDVLEVKVNISSMSGTPIQADSVKLSIPGANGPVSAPLSLSGMPNIYEGQIDIAEIPPGSTQFKVTAADIMGRTGVLVVPYVHDPGPTVTIIQPSMGSVKGSVAVVVAADDVVHPITMASQLEATLRTPGDVMLTGQAGQPFIASGQVKFSDFNPPLSGEMLLTVTATNMAGTRRKAQRRFTVDNLGPTVEILAPLPGAFVGGVTEVRAVVTDPAGVNESSVVAIFAGNQSNFVQLQRGMGDEYSGVFDVRQLGPSIVLPSLSVRATDALGNAGEAAHQIVVDNVPAQIELDPPRMRLVRPEGTLRVCSQEFDPVGDESANDGNVVPQIVAIKARIEDRGNFAPGLLVERFAGIDPDRVTLYAVPAMLTALAVDTDADGFCDDINPLLVPKPAVSASGEALALDMVPVEKTGVGNYTGNSPPPPAYAAECDQIGNGAAEPPGPLCTQAPTSLTEIVPYSDPVATVFTLPPVDATRANCVGLQLDTLNRLPEGPTCVAVRAVDKAGNVNVSPPLRLCINRGTPGVCATFPANLPNCTGRYDKASNTVSTAMTCTPREITFSGGTKFTTKFKQNEVRNYQGDI